MSPLEFDQSTRAVIKAASREALALRHDYIGPEHLLLAVAAVHAGTSGAQVLHQFGLEPLEVREAILARVQPGTADIVSMELPFTSRAFLVLETAVEVAGQMGQETIQLRHLVTALASPKGGIAADVLASFGFRSETSS